MSDRPKRQKTEADAPTVAAVTSPTPDKVEDIVSEEKPKASTPSKKKPDDSMAMLLTAQMPSEDVAVVDDALKKLERMWYDSKKNCKQASDLGAPLSIVSTMRKWNQDEAVVTGACLCILHMTYHLDASRTFFLDLGAMDCVVAALKQFPDSVPLYSYGFNLLHNLFLGAKGQSKKAKEGATKFVKELEGIPLVVEAMKKFTEKEHGAVQINACCVLERLAGLGFRPNVLQSGAIRAVAPIFDTKPRNKELEQVAKELMQRLFK